MRNQIEYKVTAKYALFTDPVTKAGGEKCTYLVPTYQALKGITESIYWKPSIVWIIDEVRIMNPIRTESKNIRTINQKSGGIDLSIYTYLSDVEYKVRAHFEFNTNRSETAGDRDENKHHNIAKRMVGKGGRRDIFLGVRECQGYVEPTVFDEGKGYYDESGELSFGFMVHGFNYPDESGVENFGVRLWNAKMNNGIIKFPRPDLFGKNDPQYPIRVVKEKATKKKFICGINYSYIEEDIDLIKEIKDGDDI